MRKLIGLLLAISIANIAVAKDAWVHSHIRKDGTYVQKHYRTAQDGNLRKNYSTKGNVNPYTGKEGTVDPYDNHSRKNRNDTYEGLPEPAAIEQAP